MRRRHFIIGLMLATTVRRALAEQPQPAKMNRIAFVSPGTKVGDMVLTTGHHSGYGALLEELSRLGYNEGQNLVVERYSGEGRAEQHFDDLARDVVSTRPDVILSASTRLALKFKTATSTIPIVAVASDPIVSGLVPSLARPGGNITGASTDAGSEIWGKRLGFLVEAMPKMANTRFLGSRTVWEEFGGVRVREAATKIGISVTGALLDGTINEAAYRRVFTAMVQDRVDSLIVSDQSENFNYRRLLVKLAAESQIPAIYAYREFVELGGLMAYSFDLMDLWRHAADQIDQILKGTKPGEIPFYQQSHFELAFNLKTAKALGLNIPSALLATADEIIE